jgi:predicted nucleotidyltransferase
MSNRKVPESIAALSEEFVSRVSELYGSRLSKVILFGSYARGEQRADSDVDFLVVLNDPEVRAYSEISFLSETTFDLSLRYGISVSAIPTSNDRLMHRKTPLTINASEEGILL